MPMTTRHLNRLFHEAADGAGIKKGVTLHTLRHYAESRIMPSCLWISGGSRRVEPALLGIILTRPKASSLPLGGLHEQLGWMLAVRASHTSVSIATLSRGF